MAESEMIPADTRIGPARSTVRPSSTWLGSPQWRSCLAQTSSIWPGLIIFAAKHRASTLRASRALKMRSARVRCSSVCLSMPVNAAPAAGFRQSVLGRGLAVAHRSRRHHSIVGSTSGLCVKPPWQHWIRPAGNFNRTARSSSKSGKAADCGAAHDHRERGSGGDC
jgi:hypothetical protein